jgi:hypothetical protein
VLHVVTSIVQWPDLWWAALADTIGYTGVALFASLVVQAAIALVGLVAGPSLRRAHRGSQAT